MSEYDVIVIGAGPAGEVCSGQLGGEGVSVCLIERELVGGECAFWACMPAKALLRAPALEAEVNRVPGVPGRGGKLDRQAVLDRRDEVIHDLDDAVQLPWIEKHGIALVRGQARFEGAKRVRVGEQTITARRAVVIAVGSGAAYPPVEGLEEVKPWTNRAATTAKAVPKRLTVLGGGPVGCELAQAWHALGSEVTLIEAAPVLLAGSEPFACEQLETAMREQGIDVRTGAEAVTARRDGRGIFTLGLADGSELRSDALLVAVGRKPHTDDLGLETIGLEPGASIPVDDQMRVPGHDWLYAIGDVNHRALLTHAGKYQARVAAATIMNRAARAEWDGARSPQVVFTEPQVAAVGHTLQEALAAGIAAKAVDAEIGRTPGASFTGKGAPSTARIVIDEQREVIIGATFTGPEVAEWLHGVTIAIVGEVPLRRLIHVIPAFPTRSEAWLPLLADWDF